jgi:hypothetical protein
MAVDACCATSLATRATREKGEPPADLRDDDFPALDFLADAFDFLADVFTAGRLACDFLIAGRFAEDDDFADDFFAPPRPADAFLLEPFAEVCLPDFDPPARAADLPRLPPVLPPDFPRDFLARVAMILLLGVGGEIQHGG